MQQQVIYGIHEKKKAPKWEDPHNDQDKQKQQLKINCKEEEYERSIGHLRIDDLSTNEQHALFDYSDKDLICSDIMVYCGVYNTCVHVGQF